MTIGTARRGARALLLSIALAVPAVAIAQQAASVASLRQEVRERPGDADAWTSLGNALLAADDLEGAKEAFLEAISLDYRLGDAHFGLGLAEYGRGDYQAALFAFNEVARLHPERFDGRYNRGVALARLRRPEEAAEAFREAIAEAEPEASEVDLVNAWTGLAGQLEIAGDFEGAAEAYAEAGELRPGDADLSYRRAEALERAGRGLEALPILIDLEGTTDDPRVGALIADIYVQQGQTDYAVRALERVLRQAEADGDRVAQASALVELGLIQRELGRDADAVASFRSAAELDDGSWQARYNLGVSLLEAGRPGDAVEPLEAAARLEPASGEARLALASALDQLGRSEEARAAARAAVERLSDPELVSQARFVLGRALYRAGEHQAAAEELQAVVSARPSDAAAQLWAGLAEYQLGNFRAAAQYYERAVQLDPASVEARVNLGAAYLASERYQDAELVYSDLVEQNPSDAESLYYLGWALLQQDRRGAARDAWTGASDLGYAPAGDALGRYF